MTKSECKYRLKGSGVLCTSRNVVEVDSSRPIKAHAGYVRSFLDSCNSLRGQLRVLGNYDYIMIAIMALSRILTLYSLNMYNPQQTDVQSIYGQAYVLNCVLVRPDKESH